MFAHITLGCSDMPLAIRFYDALLNPLHIFRRDSESDDNQASATHVCWVPETGRGPLFFVVLPYDDKPPGAGNGSMVAFAAGSVQQVDRGYHAALAIAGCDEGPPGLRPQYGPGYYGAYLRDPDGNKVHLVFHSDQPVA